MMRINLSFVIFLFSICCVSQVKDDFSDGDFTKNPEWKGDTDKFITTKSGELRLNDKEENSGNAYLSTPSERVRETTWDFYVHLYFNPSANNYAKFYLASSEENLTTEFNGYFLLIGGIDDNVSLYRQEGKNTYKLITGKSKMSKETSPQMQVKVHCDKDGQWSLYTWLLNGENNFSLEGTAKDPTFDTSKFIGLNCIYTSSRNTGFAFDNILVQKEESSKPPEDGEDEDEDPDDPVPDPNDTTPPRLLSVLAANDTTLLLTFNEEIKIKEGLFELSDGHREKYRKTGKIKSQLEIILIDKLTDGQEYTLFVGRISDLAGNRMPDIWVNYTYFDSRLQTLEFGDIIFNEIMANPNGVAGLPEAEYIELHNRTNRPANLLNWKFHYGTKAYLLNEMVIQAGSYLVLTHEKHVNTWIQSRIDVTGIKSFPELANTGKLLWLEDARGNIISWVEYSDKWYGDDFTKKGGFSLECIDWENLANDPLNWQGCTDKSGGTPGRENSIKGKCPDEMPATISYAYMLAPDTLTIHFNKPMDSSSLKNQTNYTIHQGLPGIVSANPFLPMANGVNLILSPPLQSEEVLEVELSKIKDISGYDLTGTLTVKAGLPQEAIKGDLLFNEILFDPLPGNSDYVELYNNSDKFIDLSRLYFSSHSEEGDGYSEGIALSGTLRTVEPHSYSCFSKDIDAVGKQYICQEDRMISINKLPSLPDTKGNIVLLTAAADIIDEMSYTDKMHSALLDDKEGVSLEKINPSMSSQTATNWLSASSSVGGGTPGSKNSQYRELSDSFPDNFWLEEKSFTPNDDGVNDLLVINYQTITENVIANIRVYDASGRFIYTIADNYRLESQGIFTWNGQEKNSRTARMGLYIIFIEAYTPDGHMERYKLGCALTR